MCKYKKYVSVILLTILSYKVIASASSLPWWFSARSCLTYWACRGCVLQGKLRLPVLPLTIIRYVFHRGTTTFLWYEKLLNAHIFFKNTYWVSHFFCIHITKCFCVCRWCKEWSLRTVMFFSMVATLSFATSLPIRRKWPLKNSGYTACTENP